MSVPHDIPTSQDIKCAIFKGLKKVCSDYEQFNGDHYSYQYPKKFLKTEYVLVVAIGHSIIALNEDCGSRPLVVRFEEQTKILAQLCFPQIEFPDDVFSSAQFQEAGHNVKQKNGRVDIVVYRHQNSLMSPLIPLAALEFKTFQPSPKLFQADLLRLVELMSLTDPIGTNCLNHGFLTFLVPQSGTVVNDKSTIEEKRRQVDGNIKSMIAELFKESQLGGFVVNVYVRIVHSQLLSQKQVDRFNDDGADPSSEASLIYGVTIEIGRKVLKR